MRSIWLSPRAWRLHLTLAVVLPGFGVMFYWQLHRAISGNELSWAYTIEWPIFAIYAVFMWWKLLHEDLEGAPTRRRRRGGDAEGEARDLAAYNAYLAHLAAGDEGRPEEERPATNPDASA